MTRARLLHDFVTLSAQRTPTHTAIDIPPSHTRPRQTLTYEAFETLSEQWARALRPLIEPEEIVALLLPRHSLLLFVAQQAVLRAGGAYTCLEPTFPPERMAFILEDAKVKSVFTTPSESQVLRSHLDAAHAPNQPNWIDASEGPYGLTQDDTQPPATEPEDHTFDERRLAYVIYTSGTTGQPKGVCIEHRSIVNLIQSDLSYFSLAPQTRVAQGSSPAYDSSLEEAYLALSCGGTVVVLDDEVVRLGPDLVPWLRQEQIHVLCPPPTLLRTTLCERPDEALPALSLLYVGGEALTPDIADLWAKDRWMENGYGPTECTVTVVRGRVEVGETITIGKPVSGHTAWVLDEALKPVPKGEAGELCISGVGVARGYLNRPKLTAEKFLEHPKAGRIYRTGDLVKESPSGDLLYLGRIDTQVKLRGYRIELEAIESALCQQAEIQSAACRVQGATGQQQLVAFVVLREDTTPNISTWKEALSEQLPSYMVPAHIAVVEHIATTTGGKLDRQSLPSVELTLQRETPYEAPQTPLERQIAESIAEVLGLSELSRHDDFFQVGGNSVLAAKAISLLRKNPTLDHVTVRDLYDAPSVAKLAHTHTTNTPDEEWINASLLRAQTVDDPPRPLWVSSCQMAWIGVALVLWSAVGYGIGFHLIPWLMRALGLVPFVLLSPLFAFILIALYTPISLGLAIGAKKLLIGTYQPGRYPVWGHFYWRNWLVQRFVSAIPWGLVGGTVFKSHFLRLLGAKIGKDVHIHNGVSLVAGGWDLLTIDDGAMVGRDAALRLVTLQEQHIIVGPIHIGAEATLETRAGLSPFCTMEAESFLTHLSMVTPHTTIPKGQRWDGVPAKPTGDALPPPPTTHASGWGATTHGVWLILARMGLGALMSLPGLLVILGLIEYWQLNTDKVLAWLFSPTQFQAIVFLWLGGLAVAGAFLGLLLQAWTMRWMGPCQPGTYSRWSPQHIKWWLKAQLLEGAGNTLSGTMFWPSWLRLAGMKVGAQCEISSIMEVTPELVSIGPQTFFADGIYLGTARFHRGTFTCAQTTLGAHTFLGNHSIIPGGSTLPDGILLGVSTVADEGTIKPGSSWFGHPAFLLPQREIVEADESVTFRPSAIRWWNRFFWEVARFFLPLYPLLLLLLWFKTMPLWFGLSHPLFFTVVVPMYTIAIMSALCGSIWLLKWLLLGKTKPGQHPLWSCWCSRWDFLYVAWGTYARGVLAPWEETLWLAWWLRAMGVKVGKRVVLGAGFAQVVDPDMLHFEDEATVACNFQAHSFEDRVLKMDHVHLRARSTTAAGALVMYGADVQPDAYVGPHSVIMKQEQLNAAQYHLGCPTRSFGRLPEQPLTAPGDRERSALHSGPLSAQGEQDSGRSDPDR